MPGPRRAAIGAVRPTGMKVSTSTPQAQPCTDLTRAKHPCARARACVRALLRVLLRRGSFLHLRLRRAPSARAAPHRRMCGGRSVGARTRASTRCTAQCCCRCARGERGPSADVAYALAIANRTSAARRRSAHPPRESGPIRFGNRLGTAEMDRASGGAPPMGWVRCEIG